VVRRQPCAERPGSWCSIASLLHSHSPRFTGPDWSHGRVKCASADDNSGNGLPLSKMYRAVCGEEQAGQCHCTVVEAALVQLPQRCCSFMFSYLLGLGTGSMLTGMRLMLVSAGRMLGTLRS
jgi:hypothetical protein